ncbi:MAG: UDP-3-O-(3-hydroxymyristoyl)glucosamine N-acyltransferase [Hydrotalea sp.]|nr:UDP-3-O-(3-hydroxymyristoyl)glucosamine N-acyltransferase [Hydrotalea sp.]
MTDKNIFFQPYKPASGAFLIGDMLAQIADRVGLTTDIATMPKREVRNIAGLKAAGAGDVSFCALGKHRAQLAATRAGVVLLTADLQADAPNNCLAFVMRDPQLAYALIGAMFYPRMTAQQHDIHPTAVVSKTAVIEQPVSIAPYVVIGDGVKIGKGSIIGASTVIERGVVIGMNNIIGDNCSISHCVMGNDCDIDSGVRIGGRGFGLVPTKTGIVRMPQIGQVLIGNGVCISCNSVIDRGTSGDTVIADNAQLDNMVAVGHNTQIDRSAVICSMVGLAGSVTIGAGAMLGGQVGVADHMVIGAGAKVSAQSGVASNVGPGDFVGGTPAMNHMQYLRGNHFLRTAMKENTKKSSK